MSEETLDLPEVLERVQEDKELLLELFDIFEKDYTQKSIKLKSAVQTKNWEEVKDLAHSIKGASGNISAKAMHAICLNIEKSAADGNASAILGLLPQLDSQFAALQTRIVEVKKSWGISI